MSESRAAYRYASALISVADETRQLDRVGSDIAMLSKTIEESREFRLFLKSPVINKHKKRAVFDELLKGRVSDITRHFIELVTMKERDTILPDILAAFNKLLDVRLGILRATVRAAVTLTVGQRDEIMRRLRDATGKDVRISEVLDPDVIGGFIAQFEDTVWDGSVRRQLELLRERFIGNV